MEEPAKEILEVVRILLQGLQLAMTADVTSAERFSLSSLTK